MNCNNCGKEVQANWNICPECGAKLQNTVAVATQSEKNKNKPVYKKWWFWVLLIIGLGIIGSIEEELENGDEPSADDINTSFTITSTGSVNDDMNEYTKVTIVDLERNPNKYMGTKIAIEGEVYSTDINGKDFIMQFANGNIQTITIFRDYVAYDTSGNQIGYMVSGDKCIIYGILREDEHGSMTVEPVDVIVY